MITSYKELQKIVGNVISGSLDFENTIKPLIRPLENEYLRPYIGRAMLDALRSGAAVDNAVKSHCQAVLGWFIVFRLVQNGGVTVTNFGTMRQESDTFKTAFFNQETRLQERAEINGYAEIEELVTFLSMNRQNYPIWTQSEAFIRHTETLLRYAFQVQLHIGKDFNRRTFERLRGVVRDVERVISGVLPAKFYNYLKTVNETAVMTAKEAHVIMLCQSVIAPVMEWEALHKLLVVHNGTALSSLETVAPVGAQSNLRPSLPAVTVAMRRERIQAHERMQDLIQYLVANRTHFALCFSNRAGGTNTDADAWNEKGLVIAPLPAPGPDTTFRKPHCHLCQKTSCKGCTKKTFSF